MTKTALETVKDNKTAHAQEILDQLEGLKTIINSKSDLWFGGLPAVLTQLTGMADFQSAQIRTQFGMPAPEPVEPPAAPAPPEA